MDVGNMLSVAEEAACEAGRLLASAFDEVACIESEEGRDIKLHADRRADACIIRVLATSGLPVLAEESGEHGRIDGESVFWVVDPLDGTFNYQRRIPLSCVSIALWQGRQPVLGVVHDFIHDERFSGVVGEGAWLNGSPMRVAAPRLPGAAVLATGCPVYRDYSDDSLHVFAQSIQRFKKVRMLGSAALSAAYVACGRLDAYGEDDIMLWDVAAGAALVAAAGGWVDMRPSPRRLWATMTRLSSCASLWED